MFFKLPELEENVSQGKLYRTYAISISPEMEEQLRMLKAKHRTRVVNKWLRSLWQVGLDSLKDEPKA